MAAGQDPMVLRRRLRDTLRKTREAAGFTQRDVAQAMDWSLSKLIRIETGAVGVATTDLRVLLQHYNVTDPQRITELVEMARSARERSWWSVYKDVAAPEYMTFLGYESSATIIRNHEPMLVPGLLQTEEYATEALNEFVGTVQGPERVNRLVELRMERQERLYQREDPPRMHFILNEAVLHRQVGGPAVMRRQLTHIQEVAERPYVTVRVMPFSAGVYDRMRLAYWLFEFADPEDEDALYVEDPSGEVIIREDPQQETPIAYLETFWKLEQVARTEHLNALVARATAWAAEPLALAEPDSEREPGSAGVDKNGPRRRARVPESVPETTA